MINLTSYEYIERALSELKGLLESDKFNPMLDADDQFFIDASIESLLTLQSFYKRRNNAI